MHTLNLYSVYVGRSLKMPLRGDKKCLDGTSEKACTGQYTQECDDGEIVNTVRGMGAMDSF